MNEIEEAQELQDALEWCLNSIADNVTTFRSTHSDAETVLGIKQDFEALSWVRLAYGAAHVTSDYVGWGISLLRLLDARKRIAELEDQLEMHKSVIKSLSDLEDL